MRVREFGLDLSPLWGGSRLVWVLAARLLALLGIGLTSVAVVVQVYALTGSSFQVAAVSLALGAGLLVGLLAGGVLADGRERRSLILLGSGWAVVTFGALAVNAAADRPRVWLIYLLGALFGVTEGIAESALTAVVPSLVPTDQLPATGALVTVTTTVGAIAGPLLGGLLLAGPGLATTYALAALGAAGAVPLLARLGALPPEAPGEAGAPPEKAGAATWWPALREGLAFVRRSRIVAAVLVVDLCGALFATPTALFPQFAERVFAAGPGVVGVLSAAPAAGAALASVLSGWTARLRRPGRVLLGVVGVYGLVTIGFGASPVLGLALVFLAVGGAVDTVSEILRRTLLMQHTAAHLQGRVGSLWLAQAMTAPALGGVLLGLGAGLLGPSVAVAAGGTLCVIATILVGWRFPQLWHQRLDGTEEADRDTAAPPSEEVVTSTVQSS
ncbi:MFS transporter [Micromonospora inyonensis]|uniref:MFS transporter, ENTS family, enterobactin (Siderophore) exporter n=1 Tax=Micromonospora inyonensis TaxID=47866 RepID=A0A1C6S702_9ACTN|nr:MFS transporter [Micromonospora inyonensis]SCL25243.1 MFS transporter, ENTS family, enterobactin (siderophore) exporter [Micromonospora inyonensis]